MLPWCLDDYFFGESAVSRLESNWPLFNNRLWMPQIVTQRKVFTNTSRIDVDICISRLTFDVLDSFTV
jgi:hypothetical protein